MQKNANIAIFVSFYNYNLFTSTDLQVENSKILHSIEMISGYSCILSIVFAFYRKHYKK